MDVPEKDLITLVGPERYELFIHLKDSINRLYNAETLWNRGGKKWDYEYKYRRGGKTLCGFYFRQSCLGFMVIFGKKEQEAFELARATFSLAVQAVYDAATVYHDGRWLMLLLEDEALGADIPKLLSIKGPPNR